MQSNQRRVSPFQIIKSVVSEVLAVAIREGMTTFYPETTRSEGGHLCLMYGMKLDLSPLIFLMQVGASPDEQRTKQDARERADRTRKSGTVSSYVTRNPDEGRLGGGIALDVGDGWLAFAGIPEDACEAVALATAVLCGTHRGLPLVSDRRVQEIVAASDNQKFIPLLSACQRALGS